MRRIPSWSQKIDVRIFPADFGTRNFLGWDEPLYRQSIVCWFVSGSWWYNQVSSMINNRDRKSFGSRRKIPNIRQLAPLAFLIGVQTFRDQLCGELPYVEIFMNDGPKPLTWDASCSAIDLDVMRWSSKISSSISSIISGVVTVLGSPGRDI